MQTQSCCVRALSKFRHVFASMFLLALLILGCGIPGKCKVGNDAGCPSDAVCYGGENPKKGNDGVCVYGEFSENGQLVAKIKEWRLLLPGKEGKEEREVAPLAWDATNDVNANSVNAQTDWLNTEGAFVEAVVVGMEKDKGLEVKSGHGENAQCEPLGERSSKSELWRCAFKPGWAASANPELETTETLEVKLQAGEAKRVRTYRVDAQTPLVSLTVSSVSETTVQVCARAQDSQSGMLSLQFTPPIVVRSLLDNPLSINWKDVEPFSSAFAPCWSGEIEGGSLQALYFFLEVKASDKADNLLDSMIYGSLGRLSCSTQTDGLSADAVKAPLAFANGRLLFGSSAGEGATEADNSLYFLNSVSCQLEERLHTGALEGPMVVLGESGSIAVALGGGGPEERKGARLSLIEGAGLKEVPHFVYGKDCVSGSGDTHESVVFDKGLTLFSIENSDGTDNDVKTWRFAAPANSALENKSRLMAYAPHAGPNGRCITAARDNTPIEPFTLTPVQYQGDASSCYNGGNCEQNCKECGEKYWGDDLAITHAAGNEAPTTSTQMRLWFFDDIWGAWAQWRYGNPPLTNPSGIAVSLCSCGQHEKVWLSGDGLYTWNEWEKPVLNNQHRTSPAAVDSKGRVYVAVNTDAGYELQRFSTECNIGDTTTNPCAADETCIGLDGSKQLGSPGSCQKRSAPLPQAIAGGPVAPVGSPLLGEAFSESYVVTTDGTVLALDTEQLAPLWMQSLGIRVLPTAQPVLVPNADKSAGTLWVVGAKGEVRGLHVNSPGLSQTAQWPKAFHDNCNTSSAAVTPHPNSTRLMHFTMPSCF